MQSFKLPVNDVVLPINNKKKYKVTPLVELKQKVADTKSKLDTYFTDKSFAKCWRECDPFIHEKEIVAHIGNTYNVSNAWLKCYEIINYFDLFNLKSDNDESNINLNNKSDGDFVHFDNAAFPGSFMISAHHYAVTHDLGDKYKWYASSLLDKNEQTSTPLADKYELYKRYPEHWLMTETNNGDVLSKSNQYDFKKQIGGTVSLYTSDLGFDVSSDYNNQELIQCPANIGQIISGLLTLKQGGAFITKQYTTFEPITLSVMYAAAQMFDEFYLCKPYSSREANSETYLVGKGFKNNVDKFQSYIDALFNRIEHKDMLEIPIFDAKSYPKEYIKTIIAASNAIFTRQINKINDDLKRCAHSRSVKDNDELRAFKDAAEKDLHEWYKNNAILPLKPEQRLNMKDAYHQRI